MKCIHSLRRVSLLLCGLLLSLPLAHGVYYPRFGTDAEAERYLQSSQQAVSSVAARTHHKNAKDRQSAKLTAAQHRELLRLLARAKPGTTREDMRLPRRERIYRRSFELSLPDGRTLRLNIDTDLGVDPRYAPLVLSQTDYARLLEIYVSAMEHS